MKIELKQHNKIYNKNSFEKRVSLEKYRDTLLNEIKKEAEKAIDLKLKNNLYDEGVREAEKILSFMNRGRMPLELPLKYISDDGFYSENINIENFVHDNLILNHKLKNENLLKIIKEELSTCTEFYFVISFIKFSGIQLLISLLEELEKKGIHGKILTSFYMNVTEPKALKKLSEFKNIELKIYNSGERSFHAKAYIFERSNEYGSVVIGSSNLSREAFLIGEEWNIKISENSNKDIYNISKEHFKTLWNSEKSFILTDELLKRYEDYKRNENHFIKTFDIEKNENIFDENSVENKKEKIIPNSMQREILHGLERLRSSGEKRGVVIAATGTGKTYLSSFDVERANPKTMLFLAHREELLRGAFETFGKIFDKNRMGFITGSRKDFKKDFVFATVQSFAKDDVLKKFSENHFDYIIIDEFHHSSAETYKRILNRFKENIFMLGLTATPERTDGQNVLEICNYNIAGEIRLKEALKRELLVPFHYFGIADSVVDYNEIKIVNGNFSEKDLSEKLSINKRAEFIIEKMKNYLYDGDDLKGLAFCVDRNHARFMCEEFKKYGCKAETVLGDISPDKRAEIIKKFENGEINIIFTVDVFNEGVDIPAVNLLLFLRPTESPTIFIQQLGRGLRKHKGKEFLTVLDFIGNHKKAFTGLETFISEVDKYKKEKVLNRENLEEYLFLPNGSHIELDKICQNLILEKINRVRNITKTLLKDRYREMRNEKERSLKAVDFLYCDEENLFEKISKSFGGFLGIKSSENDLTEAEKIILHDKEKIKILNSVEKWIPFKRIHEIFLFEQLFLGEEKILSAETLIKNLENSKNIKLDFENHKISFERALKEVEEDNPDLFLKEEGKIIISEKLLNLRKDKEFLNLIKDRLHYGFLRYDREEEFLKYPDRKLKIYNEYSRLNLQIIFDSNVPKGSWRAGYAVAGKDIFLFITIEKEKSLEYLNYDNYFDDQSTVQWVSQNKTSHDSKIGEMFVFHKKLGYRVHIMIRKKREASNETKPFIYLGEADYFKSSGDKPMYIKWRLHSRIQNNLFLELID